MISQSQNYKTVPKLPWIINSHELIRPNDAGNGYHGYCKHCGTPCVTDLGYDSWEGVKCKDREPKSVSEMPLEIRSFIRFNGLNYNVDKKIFIKPYSDTRYTLKQLVKIINGLI